MKAYTISIDFTTTILAENEETALSIFWDSAIFEAGVADIEEIEEVEEND